MKLFIQKEGSKFAENFPDTLLKSYKSRSLFFSIKFVRRAGCIFELVRRLYHMSGPIFMLSSVAYVIVFRVWRAWEIRRMQLRCRGILLKAMGRRSDSLSSHSLFWPISAAEREDNGHYAV